MSGPLRKRRARGLNLYLLDMTRCTSNHVSPQMLFLPFTCTICKQKPIRQQIALTLFFPANDIWCIYLLKNGTNEREEKESSIFHAAPPPRIKKSWYIMQMPIKKRARARQICFIIDHACRHPQKKGHPLGLNPLHHGPRFPPSPRPLHRSSCRIRSVGIRYVVRSYHPGFRLRWQ